MNNFCIYKNYHCNSYKCCNLCKDKKCPDRCLEDSTKCKFATSVEPELHNHAWDIIKAMPTKKIATKTEQFTSVVTRKSPTTSKETSLSLKDLAVKLNVRYQTIYYLHKTKKIPLDKIEEYIKESKK